MSDLLQDSHVRFKIHAGVSIFVLLRSFDSLVNGAFKIRSGGVTGD
jgi:hypothetical protein